MYFKGQQMVPSKPWCPPCIGIWQGVAMDTPKYCYGLPCPTLLCPADGHPKDGRPPADFYPLGYPTGPQGQGLLGTACDCGGPCGAEEQWFKMCQKWDLNSDIVSKASPSPTTLHPIDGHPWSGLTAILRIAAHRASLLPTKWRYFVFYYFELIVR
jgi:hypothetical protein